MLINKKYYYVIRTNTLCYVIKCVQTFLFKIIQTIHKNDN